MTDRTDDEGFMTTKTILWLEALRKQAEEEA